MGIMLNSLQSEGIKKAYFFMGWWALSFAWEGEGHLFQAPGAPRGGGEATAMSWWLVPFCTLLQQGQASAPSMWPHIRKRNISLQCFCVKLPASCFWSFPACCFCFIRPACSASCIHLQPHPNVICASIFLVKGVNYCNYQSFTHPSDLDSSFVAI